MFEALGRALSHGKDRALETAARVYLNGKISRFGRVEALRLDTGARKASITVQLAGEANPITVEVEEYEVRRGPEGSWLRLKRLRASRPWLTSALEQYVVGQEFKLPTSLGNWV
jgi:hypothetical protein